ncbi:MAG TPA: hypothetical protein VMT11_06965 [Myxococcaceae bacterium]|nr:hypothetical protein [Myxococcaceae bacterium]
MRRDVRIALLTAGVLLGFGSGFHALRMRHWERRLAWERHMAGLCAEAARGAAGHPSSPLLPGDEPGR